MKIHKGWIEGIRHLPSPNFYSLPDREISLLVVHNISLPPGKFGGPYIDQLFTNTIDPRSHPYFLNFAGLRVSSHLLIDREGVLTQYVSFHDCAHHAGESDYQGRKKCNDFSIGIELEGTDDLEFSELQYSALIAVTEELLKSFPLLNSKRIVGHSEIAPSRKSDPGPCFDWPRYLSGLTAEKI